MKNKKNLVAVICRLEIYMENKFYSKGELKDKKILEVLKKLPEQYENGEIAEVRDIMEEIIFAIDEFESEYENKN